MKLPNIKELFQPDPGYIICDADLDRADLQVVVAEAEDEDLRIACQDGTDVHQLNADTLGITRQLAKNWVHGTNYGGSPRTMAATCGITVHQAERMQMRWFQAHPGIEKWHDRVRESLQLKRTVWNRFGFRRFYFDRIEGIFPQALAWIPQSTVANVINTGLINLDKLPAVELLMQVHDSLVFQIPADKFVATLPKVEQALRVEIPYDPPLIIGVGLKASRKSWGECKEVRWDFQGTLE